MKNKRFIAIVSIVGISSIPVFTSAITIPLEISIGDRTSVSGLADYISVVYQFGVGVVGVLAAVMIMFNGVKWVGAAGNSQRIGDAKQGVVDALIGLTIALTSYVILVAINPSLVLITEIVTPGPNVSTTAESQAANTKTSTQKNSGTPSAECTPVTDPSSPCTVENLQKYGCFGENATKASSICHIESGGDPTIPSGVDICQPGGEKVSWGLFQINLTANTIDGLNCPASYSGGPYTSKDHTCTIIDNTLNAQCVTAATNPAKNIAKACEMSSGGTYWGYWGANSKCHF